MTLDIGPKPESPLPWQSLRAGNCTMASGKVVSQSVIHGCSRPFSPAAVRVRPHENIAIDADADAIVYRVNNWDALRAERDAALAEVERHRWRRYGDDQQPDEGLVDVWPAARAAYETYPFIDWAEVKKLRAERDGARAEVERLRAGLTPTRCVPRCGCGAPIVCVATGEPPESVYALDQTERDAALAERDEWASAIRSVATGCIPSPVAARAAIEELKDEWDISRHQVREARAELAQLKADIAPVLRALALPNIYRAMEALPEYVRALAEEGT